MIALKAYMDEKRKKTDAFMDAHFRLSADDQPKFGHVYEAMRYSLLAGGKRVRPVLCLAAHEACGGPADDPAALAVASALELIHTYSLIHDDLPAMDNDDLRRGRPTNHKVFGEAMAILAGDSLLTEAFLMIARASAGGADPAVLLEISGDIAEASGARGMAGGQVLDLESEKKKISRQELETVHRHKTGCLILVSVTSGAKLAGADAAKLAAMRAYGENVGLAFQIADDILDVEGGAEEMGKATGGDARKEKSTYPSMLGLPESKRLAQEAMQKAVDALKGFDQRADPLRELARFIVNRKS
ncbi:MAG TPA: farnesyl diphosphate synthase [bacterium]|nr:farnesyl diphosphate synthase [bacterium]